jgi:hypothetical protein
LALMSLQAGYPPASPVIGHGSHRAGHVGTVSRPVLDRAVVVLEVPRQGYLAPEVRVTHRGAAVDDGYPYAPAPRPAPGVLETRFDQTPVLVEPRIVGREAERAEVVVVDALHSRVSHEVLLYPRQISLAHLPGTLTFDPWDLQEPGVCGGQMALDLAPAFLGERLDGVDGGPLLRK